MNYYKRKHFVIIEFTLYKMFKVRKQYYVKYSRCVNCVLATKIRVYLGFYKI